VAAEGKPTTDPLLAAIQKAVAKAERGAASRSPESSDKLKSAIRTAEEQHGQVVMLRNRAQLYLQGSPERQQIERDIIDTTRQTLDILEDMDIYYSQEEAEESFRTAPDETLDADALNQSVLSPRTKRGQ